MTKRKHHFVPQFYLRAFRSEPKRIHVFNLERQLTIMNSSLRDQCYRHRFHGKTEELENHLMDMEGAMAPVIRTTAEQQVLPLEGDKRLQLIVFTVLQSLRTTAAAEAVRAMSSQMSNAIFGPAIEAGSMKPEDAWPDIEDPVLLSLAQLGPIVSIVSDLEMHLICTTGSDLFITSDNPVFKYNLYCEGTKGRGTVGWGQHGFMAFVPLSPSTLLILYDPRTYKIGSRGSVSSRITARDVKALNRMQLVGASKNVYFDDWSMRNELPDLAREARVLRERSGPQTLEYIEEKDENHSLLHSFNKMPDLKLRLSFLTIRRKARKVPFLSRSQGVRRPELAFSLNSGEPLTDDGRPLRFVRPDHHPTLKRKATERFRPDKTF